MPEHNSNDQPEPAKISGMQRARLEQRLRQRLMAARTKLAIPKRTTISAPLSQAQQRIWLLQELAPHSPVYHRPLALQINGDLDTARLYQVISSIVARHASLRTVLSQESGHLLQIALTMEEAVGALEILTLDLVGEDPEQREQRAKEWLLAQVLAPFDLTRSPALRLRLLRLSPGEHILLWVCHHLFFDAWSARLLVDELAAGLRGQLLAPLQVDSLDWGAWQSQQPPDDQALAYWIDQLQEAPLIFELPGDHPRPAVQQFDGSSVQIAIPASLLEELKQVSRSSDATLFMTLLAGFFTLLYRYTGQGDLLVGVPVAGRTHQEIEPLIGLFTNTLVMRAQLHGQQTFQELLAQVRQTGRGALVHQELPFEQLVDALHPPRSAGRTPVFQVLFNYENIPIQRIEAGGLQIEEYPLDLNIAPFDLSLEITPCQDGLRCQFLFNTSLFDTDTIHRLARHYCNLLEGISRTPDKVVSRLPLLDPDERRRVLEGWNDTARNLPTKTLVCDLIRMQAQRQPRAIAVDAPDGQFTYAQLERQANQLAHYLQELGIGVEDVVAVCLPRSAGLVSAQYATWKAGAAYLPIDSSYPAMRIQFMLEDSGAEVLITRCGLINSDLTHTIRVVWIEDLEERIQGQPDSPPPNLAGPGSLAYIIYTSGSTGQPRGVEIEQRNVAHLVHWYRRRWGLTPADRVSQTAGPGFDASVMETWPALASGASLQVASEAVMASLARLHAWLQDKQVSILFLTTPLAESFLSDPLAGQAPLRWLLTGGDRLLRRPPAGLPYPVANNYGPTECTVIATSSVVGPAGNQKEEWPPDIGQPVDNTRIYLLDNNHQPVPPGAAGEIFIGGDGVGRGYRQGERGSATSITEAGSPFVYIEGLSGRLYRTGDLARYDRQGRLHFLGRSDQQVKLRGYRIETGEIETALRQHPAVQACAVVLRSRPNGEKFLAAYIVAAAGTLPGSKELRRFCMERLPEAMVPTTYVQIPSLPLTSNGKIDRDRLPDSGWLEDAGKPAYQPPCGEVEEILASLWEELLQVQHAGRDDHFFDLGGNSLLAFRLFSLIETRFGRKLPLTALYSAPTIKELGAVLQEPGLQERSNQLAAIQSGDRYPILFCFPPYPYEPMCYYPLARALGPDQPLYSFHILHDEGGQAAFLQRIADLASELIQLLRKVQHEGPYSLAGFSSGGYLAYEVACQLTAAGEQVNLLAIFDTSAFTPLYSHLISRQTILRSAAANLPGKILYHVRHFLGLPAWIKRDYLRFIVHQTIRPGLKNGLAIIHRSGAPAPIGTGYRPRTYSGKVTLFKVTGRYLLYDNRTYGWRWLATGGVETHIVTGSHFLPGSAPSGLEGSLLEEPHVQRLAGKLKDCLAIKGE